jgi:hypothetical protein
MWIKNLKIIPIVSIVLLIIVSFFCKPSSAEGASVVWTDKDIYNQGEIIRVNFTNAPGNYNDWICIVPVGSPDTDGGDWKYIPSGLRQGVLIFDLPSPGQYEVRAYYNYYRNGYVVTGRYAFLVVNDFVEATPPPPLPFDAPPDVIVMPDTNDVYVVPGIDIDLFFWSGWWWRPWGGHWYRSLYYNHGWGYYNAIPSFYYDVDPGWRGYYRDSNWYGHRWDYEQIPHQRLQQNWKSWQNDRHWERQGTWGVQNYQPRPQQQRQELRQQRQQQYQQRQPQVQQPQRPQVGQQQRRLWGQQQRPGFQQRQRQPQVQQPQRRSWDQQPQSQSQVQQQRPQFQQRQRQPQVQQPQRQPWGQQRQRPQVQQPQGQRQGRQQKQPQGQQQR